MQLCGKTVSEPYILCKLYINLHNKWWRLGYKTLSISRIEKLRYEPNYLAEDEQHVQNHSMDIIGLARKPLEPLDARRDKHTVHALNDILKLDDHPCSRFINEVPHTYSLRFQRARVPVPRKIETRTHRDSGQICTKDSYNIISILLFIVKLM